MSQFVLPLGELLDEQTPANQQLSNERMKVHRTVWYIPGPGQDIPNWYRERSLKNTTQFWMVFLLNLKHTNFLRWLIYDNEFAFKIFSTHTPKISPNSIFTKIESVPFKCVNTNLHILIVFLLLLFWR